MTIFEFELELGKCRQWRTSQDCKLNEFVIENTFTFILDLNSHFKCMEKAFEKKKETPDPSKEKIEEKSEEKHVLMMKGMLFSDKKDEEQSDLLVMIILRLVDSRDARFQVSFLLLIFLW